MTRYILVLSIAATMMFVSCEKVQPEDESTDMVISHDQAMVIIPLNYTYEKYMSISSHQISQGSCVHGDFLIGANAADSVGNLNLQIYNLCNKEYISQVIVSGVGVNTHANTLSFGSKYSDTDIFPLLYIPTGYVQNNSSISDLYVVRLIGELDALNASVIQTIHLDFNRWTEAFCDLGRGKLWVKVSDGDDIRIRSYSIPDISSSDITIDGNTKPISDFIIPPIDYRGNGATPSHQGYMYNNGRIWYVAGNPNVNGEEGTYMSAINERNQCRESVLWLSDIGLTNGTSANYEPEACFIWDNHLFIAFPNFIVKLKKVEHVNS